MWVCVYVCVCKAEVKGGTWERQSRWKSKLISTVVWPDEGVV